MGDLQATTILQPGEAVFGRVTLPKKTAADDIQKRDFLKLNAGKVDKMAADTDDDAFCGVAAMMSKDADGPQDILVYTRCIVEVPVASGDYDFGNKLSFHTDGTLRIASPEAGTVAWAWETKDSATSLKVLVDVLALAKLFPITA